MSDSKERSGIPFFAIGATLCGLIGFFYPPVFIPAAIFFVLEIRNASRNRQTPMGYQIFRAGILLVILLSFYHCVAINFRELQERAICSRANANIHTIITALEAYRTDHNAFPPSLTPFLTTPVAYLQEIPRDPFSEEGAPIQYYAPANGGCILNSMGPDRKYDIDLPSEYSFRPYKSLLYKMYDPRNGTYSSGDIFQMYKFDRFYP